MKLFFAMPEMMMTLILFSKVFGATQRPPRDFGLGFEKQDFGGGIRYQNWQLSRPGPPPRSGPLMRARPLHRLGAVPQRELLGLFGATGRRVQRLHGLRTYQFPFRST